MTVSIDVASITESQEVTVPIPLQDDIYCNKPETITAQDSEVEKMNSLITFENIAVGYIGLIDNYALSFLDPETDKSICRHWPGRSLQRSRGI